MGQHPAGVLQRQVREQRLGERARTVLLNVARVIWSVADWRASRHRFLWFLTPVSGAMDPLLVLDAAVESAKNT